MFQRNILQPSSRLSEKGEEVDGLYRIRRRIRPEGLANQSHSMRR
jgi:hypothetical protein